ncbi:MAG: TetR family transcriptional regulator [Candidatus Sulfotelmatobacter sp.]|nr:TetR family transcriptional regulator [Candidatus Sulfotelmatobacter sp.]
MPRQADPQLEQRILDAASRLWSRGGEKALTMRGVAKAAGTTTPTVYERYNDRQDILRALRIQTRIELFAALTHTRSLTQACQRYLEYALEQPHAYEVLFDGFAQPPSLHEPWPSFNLMRLRLAQRLGGDSRKHTRLMLSLWSLMHGTAMLMIRGGVSGSLRTQMIHACLDALEAVVDAAARSKGKTFSGPKWPAGLILGEAAQSTVTMPESRSGAKSSRQNSRSKKKPAPQLPPVR